MCADSYVFDSRLQALGQHFAVIHAGVLLGHGGDQCLRNFQRPPDITQGAARAVACDHGGDGSAVAAVLGIDVLNDLFAPLVLKVHIDIGWLAALLADEALKQQRGFVRIGLGDMQAVAHQRVGCRAAPLAQNALAAGKAHQIVHRQKVHLVLQLGNQRQLVLHPLPYLWRHAIRKPLGWIALQSAFFGVVAQGLCRRFAWQH